MEAKATITLTSDFSLKDPYVAQMKAAILSINPKATIIDITHGIEKFNIRQGAFMLASASIYFPKGTVHLAVVDPDVGTKRRPILIQTEASFFVGPDNGLLILAAKNQGIKHVHQLTNPQFMLSNVSSTFHGRDVFAPAAAYLDSGVKPVEFGPETFDFVEPDFVNVVHKKDIVTGEVLYVDSFGNIITNISQKNIDKFSFKGEVNIKLKRQTCKVNMGKTYADAKRHETLLLIGSHGFLELALNQGNAAKKFKAKAGDSVKVLTE